jgi:hypothetical protein
VGAGPWGAVVRAALGCAKRVGFKVMDMNTKPKRIDVHHHIVPPNFVSALNSLNVPWTAGPEVPLWSPQQAHGMMGAMGIDAAVASPSPGLHRTLTLRCSTG